MRKWIALFLAFAMLFALSLPVFAADSEAQEAAQTLYEMGLFQGTGTDAAGKPAFDLERAPSRAEAVTMLVRLLGKEREALAGDWNTPFTDVADWAKPYVGYAYESKLTNGVSETTFAPDEPVTRQQLVTFLWRFAGAPAASGSTAGFVDAAQVAPYAETAFAWATGRKLISGIPAVSGVRLDPQGTATRTQAAVLIARLRAENRPK